MKKLTFCLLLVSVYCCSPKTAIPKFDYAQLTVAAGTITEAQPGTHPIASAHIFPIFASIGSNLIASVPAASDIVSTIADLRASAFFADQSMQVLGYYTVNDGGGGQFYYVDTSIIADNNGSIIRPNGVDPDQPGRWKRVMGTSINVLCFGAKPDGSTDASTAINAAISAVDPVRDNWGIAAYGHGKVIISRGQYKMSHPIWINTSVDIEGDGAGMFPYQEVFLKYDGNLSGIIIRATNNGFGARMPVIRNLYLRNFGVSTDSTKDGINTNTRCVFDNVAVDNFGGNGFAFVTNDSGNANNSIMLNCTAYYNAKSGLFLSGNESNNFGIYSCNFSTNGMCGLLDNSFIGINLYNCHVADNGLRNASTYSKSWVRYAGKTYQAIKYPNQKGVQPTVTTNWTDYWVENSSVFGDTSLVKQWSADSTYWITAAYAVVGTAATTHLYGCYSEGGEGKSIFNEFSVAWGGNMGADFAKSKNLRITTNASRFIFKGAGVKYILADSTWVGFDEVGGLMVGSDKVATPTHTGAQLRYSETKRQSELFVGNSPGNLAFSIIGNGYNPSGLGIATLPRTGQAVFPYFSGYYMGDVNNGSQARNILATRSGPPTTGPHAAGDFCLNIGTDTLTVGYKCITAGTPGTWIRIKSGN